jgi:hypothetical protein
MARNLGVTAAPCALSGDEELAFYGMLRNGSRHSTAKFGAVIHQRFAQRTVDVKQRCRSRFVWAITNRPIHSS